MGSSKPRPQEPPAVPDVAQAAANDVAPPGVTQPRLEVWKNTGKGRVFLSKFNAVGIEVSVPVAGERTVTLTPQERRLNQDRCASEELDFFRNGTLIPVRLLDDEYDYDELFNNSQVLSEEDARKLLAAHPSTFAKRLKDISNPVTVQRLIDLGGDSLTLARHQALQERLNEINPDKLQASRIDGGTTGLKDGVPDPGIPAPQTADWQTFTPDITYAGT